MIDQVSTDLRGLLLELYELGGPVVMILVAVSIVTLAVMLYKLWQFRAAGVGRHKALRHAVDAWDAGDEARARSELARSKSYLKPVVELAMTGRCDTARLDA